MLKPLSVAAALCALIAPTGLAWAMPMSGSYTGRVESQTPLPSGPNQIKIQQKAVGVNTGPGTPLDGATVQWTETATLTNGQGPVEGLITFTTPTGTTSSAYRGTVTTDASGRVTATGTYRDKSSTGEFAGVTGSGTFSLAYISKTEFAGEWKGDVKLPAQKSSKR